MLCEVEGCDRKAKTFRYGNLCLMHYKRYVRHGDVNDDGKSIKERALQRANSKCKYCDDKIGKYGALGMCCKHYQMYRLHGDALYYDKKSDCVFYKTISGKSLEKWEDEVIDMIEWGCYKNNSVVKL